MQFSSIKSFQIMRIYSLFHVSSENSVSNMYNKLALHWKKFWRGNLSENFVSYLWFQLHNWCNYNHNFCMLNSKIEISSLNIFEIMNIFFEYIWNIQHLKYYNLIIFLYLHLYRNFLITQICKKHTCHQISLWFRRIEFMNLN